MVVASTNYCCNATMQNESKSRIPLLTNSVLAPDASHGLFWNHVLIQCLLSCVAVFCQKKSATIPTCTNTNRLSELIVQQASSNDTLSLREPTGWQCRRHSVYHPSTPVVREYIFQKLDRRLAPLLERIFGVMPKTIGANDIFVVRYDALSF